MRVIAGQLKGSVIRTPEGRSVRPTYDRVRESVFSIVEPDLEGAAVLDLFSGSGSLGVESLSRGAARVTFVEIDAAVLGVVRENVKRLNVAGRCRLVRADALAALRRGLPGAPFDVVFVDPPYASGLALQALELLATGAALSDDALVVVERASADAQPAEVGRLVRFRTSRYGSTAVDFLRPGDRRAGREEES